MAASKTKTKRIQDTSNESSIFHNKTFKYLNIPREVFELKDITCAERMILARVIYWTRNGRACRETNRQFAELIDQSSDTARRAIRKLIKLEYIDAHYLNVKKHLQKDGYRDLTALKCVEDKMILKRKAAQTAQNMTRGGVHGCTGGMGKDAQEGVQECTCSQHGHGCTCTTKTNKEKAPPSPLPADGQSPAVPLTRSPAAIQYVDEVLGRQNKSDRREPLSEKQQQRRAKEQKARVLALTG